jgi:hypothetical protein
MKTTIQAPPEDISRSSSLGRRRGLVAIALAFAAAVIAPTRANATAQWSRKYGVACTACHTAAIPRLNYYGELFMRNGFQELKTEDGDTAGKTAVGNRLFLEDLGNLFGFRLNVIPLKVTGNGRQHPPGEYKTSVDVGNTDWLQLFVAGSIFKNVSIFIETEVASSGAVHFGWFKLGFHNLLGSQALNLWTGLIDPLELHVASGRLPMIPVVRQDIFYVSSANGKGDSSVSLRGARPAIALFGSLGPVVYEVGIDNGAKAVDIDRFKNLWGTLRAELPGGPLSGSALSIWGNWGTDRKIIIDPMNPAVSLGRATDEFWRLSPGVNLRWKTLDVIAAYVYGRDDNWNLSLDAPGEAVFSGLMAQVGHSIGAPVHIAAQFDAVFSDDAPGMEVLKVAAALSYLPRENFRLMLVPRLDLHATGPTYPRRSHQLQLAVRTMF